MASLLSPRFDGFKFKFPDSFFPDELRAKYANIFKEKKLVFQDPVEFLNSSIVSVQFLGMGNGVLSQEQIGYGAHGTYDGTVNKFGQRSRIDMNRFAHPASEQYYRTGQNPLSLVDRTFKVTFRHMLGFWNYFFLFESFFYQTMRDTPSKDKTLTSTFNVEILDQATGRTLSKVVMSEPLIEGIPELDLSYQRIRPEAQTFQVSFKFNNIDYQFDPAY